MRPYRVEYVQLAGWETDQVGLWVAENEEWLLLRHIPADYLLDGYVLLAKAHVLSRKPHRARKQVEQVLKLKGAKADLPPGFAFSGLVNMLRWVEKHYDLVEFTDEEACTFFGWVKETDAVHLWVDTLAPNGSVRVLNDGEPPFVLSEIQFIRFDTDYFNSIKLLWQYKKSQQLLKPSDN